MSATTASVLAALLAAVLVVNAAPTADTVTDGVEVSTARQWLPEDPCSRKGGMCVLASECPPGKLLNTTGLCPQQQPSGVECCYGLSMQERRCSARGGVCRPKHKCGRQLWEENADDCSDSETCCILVS